MNVKFTATAAEGIAKSVTHGISKLWEIPIDKRNNAVKNQLDELYGIPTEDDLKTGCELSLRQLHVISAFVVDYRNYAGHAPSYAEEVKTVAFITLHQIEAYVEQVYASAARGR